MLPAVLNPLRVIAQNLQNRHGTIGFPASTGTLRSEHGVGAVISWADKLWVITYLAEGNQGSGAGLFSIDRRYKKTQVAAINGCYANRMEHRESNQAFIGPYAIDNAGGVRPIPTFTGNVVHRITATARHLTDPANKVYMLTMAGLLFEVNVTTLAATQVADFTALSGAGGQPHWKSMYLGPADVGAGEARRIYAANNTDTPNGRLVMWDGATLTNLDTTRSWISVGGSAGSRTFAFGIDGSPAGPLSALLYMISNDGAGTRRLFRLPLATYAYNFYIHQEWMRTRQVEAERLMADAFGTFYELGPVLGANNMTDDYPSLTPICHHRRVIPDFTSFNGNLVLAGNHLTAGSGGDVGDSYAGQPEGSLFFTHTDELPGWGRPAGDAYWQKNAAMANGAFTDPMLVRRYKDKTIHLENTGASAVAVRIQLIHQAAARTWIDISLDPGEYLPIPLEHNADWVRLQALTAITSLTAWVGCN